MFLPSAAHIKADLSSFARYHPELHTDANTITLPLFSLKGPHATLHLSFCAPRWFTFGVNASLFC